MWSRRSLDAYHISMVSWACKQHHPEICQILGLHVPTYLTFPDEFKRLQVLALREQQDSTDLLVMEWYSGRSLHVQLPGQLASNIAFATNPQPRRGEQIANARNKQFFLKSQWIALATAHFDQHSYPTSNVLHMVDCDSGCVHQYSLPPYSQIDAVTWSPDGNSLAVAMEREVLSIWGWSPWFQQYTGMENIGAMVYSPSGNLLAVWHDTFLDGPCITPIDGCRIFSRHGCCGILSARG